ncbi:Uncharacterized protein Rs2_38618 [Raphanus sativus]|nr:Uncharacterized protein Rs2_38618 [Raphanus sativus]
MTKKKMKSISLAVIPDSGVAVSGSTILGSDLSSLVSFKGVSPPLVFGSFVPFQSVPASQSASPPPPAVVSQAASASQLASLSPIASLSPLASLPPLATLSASLSLVATTSGSPPVFASLPAPSDAPGMLSLKEFPLIKQFSSPEVQPLSGVPPPLPLGPKPTEVKVAEVRNYAALLKSSTQLQQIGTPVDHVSGAPFVLIPDENIEAAKLEFKDFVYARFHGDYPSMGKIIGIVNAVWARTGPRIFVHKIGQGIYLLRVPNPRTCDVLLSRTCWNIGGMPMFVAPWAPDYSPEEPPLTDAIVPVEMRNVPYLLFNNESLSRIATAIGKPESLAPETERKENFEVAKLFVRVDLTAPLPNKIISGFTNGREVEIDVTYPWLPVKCDLCNKYGHISLQCSDGVAERAAGKGGPRDAPRETARRRFKSRPGRSTEKKINQGVLRYVPVTRDSPEHSNHLPLEVASNVSVSTKAMEDTNRPTAPIQVTTVKELEEGEIGQDDLEDTAAAQTELGIDNALPQQVLEVQSGVVDQPALVEEQSVVVDVANVDGAVTTAVVNENIVVENSEVSGMDMMLLPTGPVLSSSMDMIASTVEVEDAVAVLPTDEPATVAALPTDESTASDSDSDPAKSQPEVLAQEIFFPEEMPAQVGLSDEDCCPAVVEEREKPFILVNNRKSSRKAAKRH